MFNRNNTTLAHDAHLNRPIEATPTTDDPRRQCLQTLLTDPAWDCTAATRQRLQIVLIALRPVHAMARPRMNDLPVESDWTLLARELNNYLDFRRLRHQQACSQGCADHEIPFSRQDWQLARQAEQTLADYHRHIRDESFVPRQADCFRVH